MVKTEPGLLAGTEPLLSPQTVHGAWGSMVSSPPQERSSGKRGLGLGFLWWDPVLHSSARSCAFISLKAA